MVNKNRVFLFTSIIIILLDQSAKLLFEWIGFYSKNRGAAFSILQDKTALMVWVAVIMAGAILYYYDKIPERESFFFALLLGGTVGNLIDRAFFGYVVDFINLSIWPSFNIADIGITVGVIGIVWHSIRTKKD